MTLRRGIAFALPLSALAWGAIIYGCATTLEATPGAFTELTRGAQELRPSSLEDAPGFAPGATGGDALAVTAAEDGPADARVIGEVRVLRPPMLADVPGGLPIVAAWRSTPTAGEEVVVAWTSRPSPAYPDGPDGPATYPNIPCALLVDVRPATAAEVPGWNGAMLQVNPRWVFKPVEGSWFSDPGGQPRLRFTPPPYWAGLTFYLQVVWADNRLAPAVRLTIGHPER